VNHEVIAVICVYLGLRAVVDFILFTIIGEDHIVPFFDWLLGAPDNKS
jgi:hypothetical protein